MTVLSSWTYLRWSRCVYRKADGTSCMNLGTKTAESGWLIGLPLCDTCREIYEAPAACPWTALGAESCGQPALFSAPMGGPLAGIKLCEKHLRDFLAGERREKEENR